MLLGVRSVLPAVLAAVSGTASRFLTPWDPLGWLKNSMNTVFIGLSVSPRADYEARAGVGRREGRPEHGDRDAHGALERGGEGDGIGGPEDFDAPE